MPRIKNTDPNQVALLFPRGVIMKVGEADFNEFARHFPNRAVPGLMPADKLSLVRTTATRQVHVSSCFNACDRNQLVQLIMLMTKAGNKAGFYQAVKFDELAAERLQQLQQPEIQHTV